MTLASVRSVTLGDGDSVRQTNAPFSWGQERPITQDQQPSHSLLLLGHWKFFKLASQLPTETASLEFVPSLDCSKSSFSHALSLSKNTRGEVLHPRLSSSPSPDAFSSFVHVSSIAPFR